MLTNTLENLEKTLSSYQNSNLPVTESWKNSCNILNIEEDSGWFKWGMELAKSKWFLTPSNPYHDNVHTAQVMHSGAVLLSSEIDNNPYIDKEDVNKIAPLFLTALMFHDYAHNGKTNTFPFELENESFKALEHIILFDEDFYKAWSEEIEFELTESLSVILSIVSSLIQATEVTVATPTWKGRYKDRVASIKSGEIFDSLEIVFKLMSEADLLPSALPNLGRDNGKKLAEELGMVIVGSPIGRLGFLKTLDYSSYAAKALELDKMVIADMEKIKLDMFSQVGVDVPQSTELNSDVKLDTTENKKDNK